MNAAREFFVPGMPAAQGSMRLGRNRRTGAPVILHDSSAPLKAWRRLVAIHATGRGVTPTAGPVAISVSFRLPRPKHHRNREGKLTSAGKAAFAPCNRGRDLDKMIRALLDALTGVAFHDDSQVVCVLAEKKWASTGEMGTVVLVNPEASNAR